MAELDNQLEDVLLALEGFKKTNEPLTLKLDTRQELAQIMKWDLEPKAGISAITEYIRRNRITPDMIKDFDMTLRNDGMLTIVLIWGRVHPIIIAGPKGDTGPRGEAGPRGFRGLNAQCECPEILVSSSSTSSSSTSSSTSSASSSSSSELTSSSSSEEFSSSSSESSSSFYSSSSSEYSSSSSSIDEFCTIQEEDEDDILLENDEPLELEFCNENLSSSSSITYLLEEDNDMLLLENNDGLAEE